MNVDRLAEHRDRAGVYIRGLRFDDEAALTQLRSDVLRTLRDDQALSLYVLVVDAAAAHRGWEWPGGIRLFTDLGRRPLAWTAADVALLFDLAEEAKDQTVVIVFRAAVAAAEQLDPAQRAGCVEGFERARRRIDEGFYDSGERARLQARLRLLVESARPPAPATVRTGVFFLDDGWGLAAVEHLREVTTDADAISDLLSHAATIPRGPRPSKAWLRRTGELVADRPGVATAVRDLLELARTCEPFMSDYRGWGFLVPQRIGLQNADLARGLVWTAVVIGAPWLTSAVVDVHAGNPDVAVLNSCFAALGWHADAAAVAALVQLQRTTRNRGELTQIARALDEAAANAGISRAELTEQTIPDAGLDARRERRADGGAVLSLDDRTKVRLEWEHAGTRTTRPPADADPQLVRDLKRAAADLKKLVASERDRLEDLLVEQREWPLATWRRRYVDHPVTGGLAHRLLWTVIVDGRSVTGLPTPDGTFTLVDGDVLAPGGEARVRVWHPVIPTPTRCGPGASTSCPVSFPSRSSRRSARSTC
jgi:hypothetical protein